MATYYRTGKNNQYAPFKLASNNGFNYDLRLKKDGITANIIGTAVVSLDGTDNAEVADKLMGQLNKLGYR